MEKIKEGTDAVKSGERRGPRDDVGLRTCDRLKLWYLNEDAMNVINERACVVTWCSACG